MYIGELCGVYNQPCSKAPLWGQGGPTCPAVLEQELGNGCQLGTVAIFS